MKKTLLIFFLTFIIGILPCGCATPLPKSEPGPATRSSPTPESAPVPVQSPMAESGAGSVTGMQPTVSAPMGLRVVYIRDGNLWSWTEAGGKVQLTNTNDMATARVSDDGQVLAFMRGSEVWTVRMDGMDASLLATQTSAGGALWFSPDGLLLAVSTNDHIDVINLMGSSSVTVVNYPALPDGYFPEVIWSPDSFGFKTVIPTLTANAQVEMLFVFTDGTVASLAKFVMSPLSESLPHLSPDGGYLIYVANLDSEQESLYLMDSSGATRPYGEAATHIQTYGWLPDSKQFVYGWEESRRTFIGNIGEPPASHDIALPRTVRWVDNEHYLAIENGDLVLGDYNGARTLIDFMVTDFDFIP